MLLNYSTHTVSWWSVQIFLNWNIHSHHNPCNPGLADWVVHCNIFISTHIPTQPSIIYRELDMWKCWLPEGGATDQPAAGDVTIITATTDAALALTQVEAWAMLSAANIWSRRWKGGWSVCQEINLAMPKDISQVLQIFNPSVQCFVSSYWQCGIPCRMAHSYTSAVQFKRHFD